MSALIDIPLPQKPTCTTAEAGRTFGVSERQVRSWIETGELLAVNVAGSTDWRPTWRVVVKMPRPKPATRYGLTLEEFRDDRTNQPA